MLFSLREKCHLDTLFSRPFPDPAVAMGVPLSLPSLLKDTPELRTSHPPCTSTCTTHPAIPSPLPSTTLLCTQLANTEHSWQNGTRCRDGVNVLWCRSHLVWLVFEGSIPTCAGFHSGNFFVTCIQWNLSNMDTTGTKIIVLISEVSEENNM